MNKILLIAIALMAMIGTAAATSYVAGTIYLADGTTTVPYASVTAYNDSGLTAVEGTDTANGVGNYVVQLTTLTAGNTVYVKAVSGTNTGTASGVLNDYSNLINFDLAIVDVEIPEFPTIALPVAAILGLAFIFQRRREEE